MPLYEYQCDACGNRFEAIQKFSDPPLEVCPRCGGSVKKLQSAPAFQFKGSGWYITDYARKDQAAPGEKDKKPEKTEGATPSKEAVEPAKSETKTEKKTETTKSEVGSQKSDSKKADSKKADT